MSYHNRGISISKKISYLFSALDSQTYDEVAPVIESWIEVGLTQDLTTEGDLIEQVLDTVAWTGSRNCSHSSFTRFLKEFRDSPHRSAQAKSFVDGICTRRFRWFLAASADDLSVNWSNSVTARNGGNGFIEEASVVGHLIEYQLLDHELVRLHLIKGLTHHYPYPLGQAKTVRAAAIYRLFAVAGKTLLRGLLEPEDVRVCFEMLETQLSSSIGTNGLSTANLQVWCTINASRRNMLTCVARNSVSSMPHGCSGVRRRDRTTKRELEDVREKEVKPLPKSLQMLKHPLLSLKIYLQ